MSNASFSKQLKNKGAIGTDKLENILNVYSDISPTWLITGKGEMLKSNELPHTNAFVEENAIVYHSQPNKIVAHEMPVETRPRIPFDAAAGSLSDAIASVSNDDCEQIPVIPTFPRYDFTIIARGDSMEPQYLSGDELACLFIKERSFVQWGRAHVLDTAQGVVVKRIFDAGDRILCKSNNPDYPDFSIPKTDIYHMALVVGYIRIE